MFLNELIKEMVKEYPDIWELVKQFRKDKGKSLPDWEDWCYLPIAASIAIATRGDSNKLIEVMCQKINPPLISALVGWRVTKGVYRFAPELYDTLINQSFEGKMPCEVLKRLPEWCIYIECIKDTYFCNKKLEGFLVYLDYDVNTKRSELRFVLFAQDKTIFHYILHIGDWTVEESVNQVLKESEHQYEQLKKNEVLLNKVKEYKKTINSFSNDKYEDAVNDIKKILNLVLYLCADNVDIPKLPQHPKERVRLSGNVDVAKEPKIWTVGERVSLFLKKHYYKSDSSKKGSSHSSPRPHIRKAHWHSFWTGKINSDSRKLIVKWLPPIPVNISDEELIELPNVIKIIKNSTK